MAITISVQLSYSPPNEAESRPESCKRLVYSFFCCIPPHRTTAKEREKVPASARPQAKKERRRTEYTVRRLAVSISDCRYSLRNIVLSSSVEKSLPKFMPSQIQNIMLVMLSAPAPFTTLSAMVRLSCMKPQMVTALSLQ